MSLTGIGELIEKSNIASSKQEYRDQLDTFYSYLRWCEILQQLGKEKNEALARLLANTALFAHVFTALRMDDHMVRFLCRTDPEVAEEIKLFAALSQSELESARTGWVRLRPAESWPTEQGAPQASIDIPKGTVLHPADDSSYLLETVLPWIMVKSDTETAEPGVVIPVRTQGTGAGGDLPAGADLVLAEPIEGIGGASNPVEIRRRDFKHHDLERVIHDNLTPDMKAPEGAGSAADPAQGEKKDLEEDGLQDPRLARAWAERNLSGWWKTPVTAGTIGEGFLGAWVVLRMTSYLDAVVGYFKPEAAGIIRSGTTELMRTPVTILEEVFYRGPVNLWRRYKGEAPLRRNRWSNTRKYARVQAEVRSKAIRERFGPSDKIKDPRRKPLLDAERELQPERGPSTPDSLAKSAADQGLSDGKAIKSGAVDIELGSSIEVQRTMLDPDMMKDCDLQPAKVRNDQAAVRRVSAESADPKLLGDIQPSRSVVVDVKPSVKSADIDKAKASGANVDQPKGGELGKTEVAADGVKSESMWGDAAGIVIFLAVDILMGWVEAKKEEEAWEDAAGEVRDHVNYLATYLKGGTLEVTGKDGAKVEREVTGLIPQYVALMKLYQQALAEWNEMCRDVFLDSAGTVQMYPTLMPAAHAGDQPGWVHAYVPVDGGLINSDAVLRMLEEDGLPKEIKGVDDPKAFVGELGKDGGQLPLPTWTTDTSSIDWNELAAVAARSGQEAPDAARLAGDVNFTSTVLNVFDVWSEQFTENLAQILKFRLDLVHWVTNKQQTLGSDGSKLVTHFIEQMTTQINLVGQLDPNFENELERYRASRPDAPAAGDRSGTSVQQLAYYTFVYEYMKDVKHLSMDLVGEVPDPSGRPSKVDLTTALDEHIEIFAASNFDSAQKDAAIAELERVVHEFGAYSDLMVLARAAKRPHGATPTTISDSAEPAGTTDQTLHTDVAAPPAGAGRVSRPALEALAEIESFLTAFLQQVGGLADRAEWLRRAPTFWPNVEPGPPDPDFPVREIRRYQERWDRRWGTQGLSDDMFDIPGFAALLAVAPADWGPLVESASPSFAPILQRYHDRVHQVSETATREEAFTTVADALFELGTGIDEEIDAGRLDINADALMQARRYVHAGTD